MRFQARRRHRRGLLHRQLADEPGPSARTWSAGGSPSCPGRACRQAGMRYRSEMRHALAALMLLTGPALAAEPIVGRASVTDGDMVVIRGTRIRLYGIDAPESAQLCQDAAGKSYPAGRWQLSPWRTGLARQTSRANPATPTGTAAPLPYAGRATRI